MPGMTWFGVSEGGGEESWLTGDGRSFAAGVVALWVCLFTS